MGKASGTGAVASVNQISRGLQLAGKRMLDVTISIVALLLLAVPFGIIAVAIKFDSKGPVFFRQERVGKGGKVFRPWKFRTMAVGQVEEGMGRHVSPDDPWITRVGRVLREWGLDELPQLLNVLVGQMSLVGPRPTLQAQVERYNDFQRRRLFVKPGITGWALIHGRNRLPWSERIVLDNWYIDNWSLWLDIKIVILTVWVVLVKREGVYGEGEPDI